MTLSDLARAAGVSIATASRALSAPERVSPDTRDRIRELAAQLGYRTNRSARGLSTGRTGNIGVLVPDLENPFFAGIVKGVQRRSRSNGTAVVVADFEEDARLEADVARTLGEQVDGLVLCSSRLPGPELAALARQLPLVLVNREQDGISAVTIENADGARQAVTHLHALGHRRIASVPGRADSWSSRARVAGIAAAATALNGIELQELPGVAPVFEGGGASADLVLAGGASAVVCHNDLVALGVVGRLRSRGVRIPEDVSVIGFDDIPVARLVSPSLTTLAVPFRLLGATAVDLLASPSGAVERRVIPPSLVVRDSTAVAPRSSPPHRR